MRTASIRAIDLRAKVERCRGQQERWARLSPRERLRPVRTFRHLLVDAQNDLTAAVARDIGKPADETLACELLPLGAACRFLERDASRVLRPRSVLLWQRPLWLWGQSDTVQRRPRGLVGIIGTWNYPLFLNGVQILQALTAGNGVLWKPSEVAPASAAVVADLIDQAGFPSDLVQLLEATRAAGRELADADVDHIVFTGSAATARGLAENLGRRLVSSTLELSGCDALFVLPDGDARLAARAAWFGATLNRGQTCLAVRRAFVHRSLYDHFLDALTPVLAAAKPLTLVVPEQARLADQLVHEAISEGARRLPPGASSSAHAPATDGIPCAFAPTVVVDARPEMALCRQATFAPVLAVLPYDRIEEAVRGYGLCAYGLGASIFTASPGRAARLAASLRVGMVTINEVIVPSAHPATPFGGRGDSGWGVTQGVEGLLEMTAPQVVSVSGGLFRPRYELPGGLGGNDADVLAGLFRWRHAATVRERWRGFVTFCRGCLRRGW